MYNIESIYSNYEEILQEFTQDVISNRYSCLFQECNRFLDSLHIKEAVRVDEVVLMHAVLDYFSDVSRLKKYHPINHINEIKVISYESFWLLRRKPLQIVKKEQEDDILSFVNEKFVFSRIASFLVGDRANQVLKGEDKRSFLNYLDTLYYFLKYRQYDPQMLELMMLGFRAGELWGRQEE